MIGIAEVTPARPGALQRGQPDRCRRGEKLHAFGVVRKVMDARDACLSVEPMLDAHAASIHSRLLRVHAAVVFTVDLVARDVKLVSFIVLRW